MKRRKSSRKPMKQQQRMAIGSERQQILDTPRKRRMRYGKGMMIRSNTYRYTRDGKPGCAECGHSMQKTQRDGARRPKNVPRTRGATSLLLWCWWQKRITRMTPDSVWFTPSSTSSLIALSSVSIFAIRSASFMLPFRTEGLSKTAYGSFA